MVTIVSIYLVTGGHFKKYTFYRTNKPCKIQNGPPHCATKSERDTSILNIQSDQTDKRHALMISFRL
jgi:hypothetical protein